MRLLGPVIVAATLVVGAVTPALAQVGANDPAGIWATVSAGRGDLQVNCAICRETRQSSWSALAAVGGSVGPRVKVGGELGAWRRGGDEATQRVMLIGAVSQLYPLAHLPAFIKVGAGIMTYRASDGEESLGARSLAIQAGFGYDLTVGTRFVLVPHAGLVHGMNGGLYLDNERVTDRSRVKLLQFGLGVGVR